MNIKSVWIGRSKLHYNTVLWGYINCHRTGFMWWDQDTYIFWSKGKGIYFQEKKANRKFLNTVHKKKQNYAEITDQETKDRVLNEFGQYMLTRKLKNE